ncbi:putative bifunctional diguanylate cyclase/phosphodiesterase [Massilia yuzhufengensis]|uniref:PAS domain S-box-containing protein/diguanylate cyclase (GGDEF) domain-containing protein n=1 Tax=Massilia yuzhufengensis TaxID=1164594 RepID=A0A1I1RCR5_9BURK|nr:bifunctional diguanylate cyclase/phosphodiesterase [Massilia yuzhufengensis]SFD32032.1 PAS domain S-box-containing protein/diguanylate cyclase (GGDEF) domain-containing protein [Massilia yuzhufengensis]
MSALDEPQMPAGGDTHIADAHVDGAPALSLELLLQNLPGAAYRCLNDGVWTMEFVSDGIEKLCGYPPAAFMARPGIPFASVIVPEDRIAVERGIALAIEEHRAFQLTYRIRCANGAIKWICEQGSVAASGKVLEGLLFDFTRVRNADMLVHEQASYLQRARDGIVAIDINSRITYWNNGAERLYGWNAAEVRGRKFSELLCGNLPAYHAACEATLSNGEWSGELAHVRRDGVAIETDTRWTLIEADEALGAPQKILVISTDISERKHSEAKIYHLAFFDALTDLPNRASLLDHLRRALLGSARTRKCGALMFCDLDNFKYLNDSQGHAAGDMLLQAVARRLEHCVREADMVARLGGDEFVILIQPVEDTREGAATQAETVAAKVVAAMAAPFQLAEMSYSVSVSVGVTTMCGTVDTVESTLRQADAAMYEAKACGRNTYRFHDPAAQAAWSARAELENAMRRALRDDEFVLHYQPQLDRSTRVIGAEALLRWRLPDGKLLYPAEFIHAAEESGLIIEMGRWVLRTACAELARWQRYPDTAGLTLSVNVSASQFIEPDFVPMLQQIFEQTGVQPSGLKLELTESLVVSDFTQTARTMGMLKQRGISFSLDDFGTGYSSLAYLRKLPLDQLKIDQSFMRDVLTDQNDASIVRSIIALGDSLGLQVIAEGVETPGQRQFLSDAGCFIYQGFLYQHALSAEHFTQYARMVH